MILSISYVVLNVVLNGMIDNILSLDPNLYTSLSKLNFSLYHAKDTYKLQLLLKITQLLPHSLTPNSYRSHNHNFQ